MSHFTVSLSLCVFLKRRINIHMNTEKFKTKMKKWKNEHLNLLTLERVLQNINFQWHKTLHFENTTTSHRKLQEEEEVKHLHVSNCRDLKPLVKALTPPCRCSHSFAWFTSLLTGEDVTWVCLSSLHFHGSSSLRSEVQGKEGESVKLRASVTEPDDFLE